MADKQPENLFATVANGCLIKAKELLKKETTPTAATVEMVEKLVGIALSIDALNYRWTTKNLSGTWAYSGPASLNPKAGN